MELNFFDGDVLDSGADVIIYGMGEQPTLELSRRALELVLNCIIFLILLFDVLVIILYYGIIIRESVNI